MTNIYYLYNLTCNINKQMSNLSRDINRYLLTENHDLLESIINPNEFIGSNKILITNNEGKIRTSEVYQSNLDNLVGLNENAFDFLNSQRDNNIIQNTESFTNLEKISFEQLVEQDTIRMIYSCNVTISEYISAINVSNIQQGVSNKYIVNDVYHDDLIINNNIEVLNILNISNIAEIQGKAILNESLRVVSLTNTPAFIIYHSNNQNIAEIDTVEKSIIITSSGNIGLGVDEPSECIDIFGDINCIGLYSNSQPFSYFGLSNIPSEFPSSTHTHTIEQINGLRDALNNKHDIISNLSISTDLITIDGNLNLTSYSHQFIQNNADLSSSWIDETDYIQYGNTRFYDDKITVGASLNNDPIVIGTNDSDNIGFLANQISSISGNIIIEEGDTITKSCIVNKSVVVESDNNDNKWRILSIADSTNDIFFETSNLNQWKTKARIKGKGTRGYMNFTGIHHCKADDYNLYDNKFIGYIVSSTKKYKSMNSTLDSKYISLNIDKNTWDALPVVTLASEKDKNVFGVISKIDDINNEREEVNGNIISYFEKEDFDRRLHIAGVGEGCVWVCDYNNMIIKSGDFITSSPIHGVGMRQYDDIVHNYTVGKATMDCDFSPKLIPVKILSKLNENTFIDLLDDEGNIVYEHQYEMKYIKKDGTITDKTEYMSNTIDIYRMAFIGCSYMCS